MVNSAPNPLLRLLLGVALGALGVLVYLDLPKASLTLTEVLIATFWGALAFAPREAPRFGIAAGAVLVAGVAVRWFALDALLPARVLEVYIASQTVPRAAMIVMAWVSRPAGNGTAERFGAKLTIPVAMIAIVVGIAAALLCGVRPGMGILVGSYLIVRLVIWFSDRYAGGLTGDSLGITQLLTELFVLLLFMCSACRW